MLDDQDEENIIEDFLNPSENPNPVNSDDQEIIFNI